MHILMHTTTKHIEVIDTQGNYIIMYPINAEWHKTQWPIISPAAMQSYIQKLRDLYAHGYKRIDD